MELRECASALHVQCREVRIQREEFYRADSISFPENYPYLGTSQAVDVAIRSHDAQQAQQTQQAQHTQRLEASAAARRAQAKASQSAAIEKLKAQQAAFLKRESPAMGP